MEDQSIGARSTPPTESTLPAVLANLKHAVPAAPLIKVNAASRRVRTRAPGTVDPPGSSALPAGLKRSLPLGPGRFLLSGPIALLTRDLLMSAALRAKLHRSRAALAVKTTRRRFGAAGEWRSQRRAPWSRQSHQHRKDFHCRSKLALEPIRSTDWDFSYNRMGSESSSERRWGCFCEQRMP